MKNKLHQKTLGEIKSLAKGKVNNAWVDSYLGTKNFHFGLTVPQLRTVVKDFIINHKDLSLAEFKDLLDSLYSGQSFEEKTITDQSNFVAS